MKAAHFLFLAILIPALVSPSFCFHDEREAEHVHDNIDDAVEENLHAHTHRHSPDEPEHSHEHSHQAPNVASVDFPSIFQKISVFLPPAPVMSANCRYETPAITRDFSSVIFRPPIA